MPDDNELFNDEFMNVMLLNPEVIMGFDDLTDEEIDKRIKKAVELEREGLKVMGLPLVQWDDELNCVVKIMPNGEKQIIERYEGT